MGKGSLSLDISLTLPRQFQGQPAESQIISKLSFEIVSSAARATLMTCINRR